MNEVVKIIDRISAIDAINKLGEDDLRYLNKLIVDRIHFLAYHKRQIQLQKFYPGDRVKFKTPDGEDKTGLVIRVNQKTLSVSTGENDGWWKLSPGLVTKINDKEQSS